MDTDATRVIDSQENTQLQDDATAAKQPKGKTNTVQTAAAAVAGAALGAAGELAAQEFITNKAVETPAEETPQPEAAETPEAAPEVAQTQPVEPEVVVVHHPATEPAPEPILVSEPAPAPEPEPDPDVHILGMAVKDNGQGGMATVAGVQVDGEVSVLVDVESDGTFDLHGRDANHDGQLQADEWHDIRDANLQTSHAIEAYIEQEQGAGRTAMVTDLNSGQQYPIQESPSGFEAQQPEDDYLAQQMYETTQPDMPDYVNDADAGMMDA